MGAHVFQAQGFFQVTFREPLQSFHGKATTGGGLCLELQHWGLRDGWLSGAQWPDSLAYLVIYRPMRGHISETTMRSLGRLKDKEPVIWS